MDGRGTPFIDVTGVVKVGGTTVIDASRIFYAQTRVEIQGSGGWAYTRLKNSASVMWDIAANPADNSSALQFRPSGSGTNATLMSTSGNWTINGTINSGVVTTTGIQLLADAASNANDGSLYIRRTNNNDWGLFLKGTTTATDYGIKVDLNGTHSYAFRGMNNNAEYFRVGTDMLLHNAQIRGGSFNVGADEVIDANRNLNVATGAVSGKFAVMSSSVHGSFDFYNNGTTYLNGAVTLDAATNISSGGLSIGGVEVITAARQLTNIALGDINTNKLTLLNGASANMEMFVVGTGTATTHFRLSTASSSLMELTQAGNLSTVGQIFAKGNTQVGEDGTYGGYGVLGFGGITNGYNRVFGRNSTGDGLFLASATGRGVFVRTNGSGSDTFSFTSAGQFQVGSQTIIDASRNITAGTGNFTELVSTQSSHNYLRVRSSGVGEAMIRYSNTVSADWYVGLRNGTSNSITNTGYHVYSATAGATVGGWNADRNFYTSNNATIAGTISSGAITSSGNITITGNITASGDGFFNGSKLEGDSKEIIRFNDSWLRLNPANEFTSGIYCATGILRTDGNFQIGTGGAYFNVTSSGNVTVAGTISSGAITSSGNLDVKQIGADTVVDIRGNSSYDPVLNLRSDQGAITTEGFQIWYDNSVGDVHLHTTHPVTGASAIRFHTATGTDKATNNERFTINGNGDINIVSGGLYVGGQEVITSGRVLTNIALGDIDTNKLTLLNGASANMEMLILLEVAQAN